MASLNDVADVLLSHDDPVVTAGEVADALDCTSRHALDQLRLLERNGEVRSKEVGARAVAFWHERRVTPPHVAPEDHPDQSDLRDHEATAEAPERDVDRRDDAERQRAEASFEVTDDLDDDLDALDLRGSGDLRVEREAAVRACYDLVKERGTAQKADFVSEVRPEHPAGYDSTRSWYDYVVLNGGLRGLADRRDDLRAPPEGGRTWRFVGE